MDAKGESKTEDSKGEANYGAKGEPYGAESHARALQDAKDSVPGDRKPCITAYIKTKSLVDKVSDFYYCDDNMQRELTQWCIANCGSFPDSEQLDEVYEHSLEHTKLFTEYCSLFEKLLEKFIRDDLGVSIETFYQELQAECVEEHSDADTFVQILNAATDYSMFVDLMRWAQTGELDEELTEEDNAELRKAFEELDAATAVPKSDHK